MALRPRLSQGVPLSRMVQVSYGAVPELSSISCYQDGVPPSKPVAEHYAVTPDSIRLYYRVVGAESETAP